jgi:hypothetical protein
MKSYYSISTSETEQVRIPMVQSLEPAEALLLGAVIAANNQSISELIEKRGELLLGCLMGTLIEGAEFTLGSQESLALSKMLVSDIATLMFKTFESLEESLSEAEADGEELDETEAYDEAVAQVVGDNVLNSLESVASEDDK